MRSTQPLQPRRAHEPSQRTTSLPPSLYPPGLDWLLRSSASGRGASAGGGGVRLRTRMRWRRALGWMRSPRDSELLLAKLSSNAYSAVWAGQQVRNRKAGRGREACLACSHLIPSHGRVGKLTGGGGAEPYSRFTLRRCCSSRFTFAGAPDSAHQVSSRVSHIHRAVSGCTARRPSRVRGPLAALESASIVWWRLWPGPPRQGARVRVPVLFLRAPLRSRQKACLLLAASIPGRRPMENATVIFG